MNNDIYWANKPTDELVNELESRIESFDKHLQDSGVMNELRDSYQTFYGDSKVREVGAQGELVKLRVNHYASLVRSLVSMVSQNKPAWQPIASNSDSSSQSSAILASSLLDYYLREKRLDRLIKSATLMSCFLREAWVATTWNTQDGNVIAVDPETEQAFHEGDIEYKLFSLNDVIRDFRNTSSSQDWLITRDYINKWDLVAQFPEHKDKILSVKSDEIDMSRIRLNNFQNSDIDDIIPYYTFYFKQSASIVNGRMVQFVNGQILTDNALPYSKIPLVRISAEDAFDNCFGHSPLMDVLPIQKSIDMLVSALVTNNRAFAVQNIAYPKGSGIPVSHTSGNLNLIEYDPNIGEMKPIQLTASAPESYKLFDMLVNQSQLISNISSAVRGEASAAQSGAALALLANQSINFNSGLMQSYTALIEDVGTQTIELLKKFANNKRTIHLIGKNNTPYLKDFVGQELADISRVVVESGNALSRTASGKMQIADSLLQSGMIQRPEQYIQVLTTGQLEPLYENEQKQLILIRKENERLAEGQQVRALLTDDHDSHILEHASVLSNPDLRNDPNSPIIANTLAHIQEHLDLAQNMNPALAMLLKQQPLPQPMPQQQAPQGQPSQVMDATNGIEQAAQQVNQPQMPTDPQTNERFQN